MGCPEVSTPTPDLWSYQRSQAWADWPDIKGQTRHGKSLKMAVPKRPGPGECSPKLSLALSYAGGGVCPPLHNDLKLEGWAQDPDIGASSGLDDR